jgi:hypothetical protein
MAMAKPATAINLIILLLLLRSYASLLGVLPHFVKISAQCEARFDFYQAEAQR